MESKDEKKVICTYWKKSNKESKGLPDTDCRQEIRSPQEMMQHIQEEHPWLKWSIQTSKKHFEEEIKALEDNELEELENDQTVSKKCQKYPTTINLKNPQDTSTSTVIDNLVQEVESSNNYVKNNKKNSRQNYPGSSN